MVKKLGTDTIIAIVILVFVLSGGIIVGLAFGGVFDKKPTQQPFPPITPPKFENLPTTVSIF